jgi:hypothetical protein
MAGGHSGMSEHRVTFPFVKVLASVSGGKELYRWKPGVRNIDNGYDCDVVADGEGEMVLREVSRHRPAKQYATRVFYTRHWVYPCGHETKPRIMVISAAAFTGRASGYRVPYDLTDALKDAEVEPWMTAEDWAEAKADAASW